MLYQIVPQLISIIYKLLDQVHDSTQMLKFTKKYFQVCSKIIQEEVEATYRNIQKYLGTLIGYRDLWSLNPKRVLQMYKNKARDTVSTNNCYKR